MTTTDTITFLDALQNMGLILTSLAASPLVIFLLVVLPMLILARKAF